MPEALKRLQQQAIEIWKEMDGSQKTRMILIGILVIASISAGIFFLTRPNYENLFSGSIDAKEVGEISKVLQDNRIEHKLTNGGTSIQVKSKDVDSAQLVLAQDGYPKGGMTFTDALSSIKISTTESDKKKIFKEYTEQKISRGLGTIDNISSAVVNLSLPENDVLLGESKKQEPTASVLIEASDSLSKKQISGIENFVAGSVEGLDRKNVMVVDKNTGELLNDNGDDDLTASTTKQRDLENERKKQIESQVKDLLGGMYDGIKVAANVVCDFNTETSKSVKYTPVVGEDSGIVRNTETHKEEVQNGDSGGVPGTDSNTGATTPSYPTGSSSGSSYKKNDVITNYEINQENTESAKALGQMNVEKSSITVGLLYGTKKTDAPTTADIETYTKMISNATGIVSGNVTIASFKLPPVQVEKAKFDWMGLLTKTIPLIILAVLIILLGVGVTKQGGPEGAISISGFSRPLTAKASNIVIEDEPLQEIEIEEKSEVKKQIEKFVKHKPDAVAQLLRNWLSDEWD